jgi:hypothetical protein
MHNETTSVPAFGLGKHTALASYNYESPQSTWLGVIHPGACFELWGNLFMCVRNRSGGNLVVGEAVSLLISDATRTGNLATGTTAALLLTDDTHDSNMVGYEPLPSYVTVTAGAMATTPTMQRRHVLKNTPATTASTIRVAPVTGDGMGSGGPLDTDLTSASIITGTVDNTYDYTFLEPWAVVKADADALVTQAVQGIVVSTVITDNYLGVIQITGWAMALVNGTTDAPVGSLLVASSTAGELVIWTITDANATTIAAEILNAGFIAGRITDSYTDGNPGLRQIQLMNRPLINYPLM